MRQSLLMITSIIFLISCSVGLEDINKNPNALNEVTSNLLLPGIQGQAAKNLGSQPMRVAGIIMNQLQGADICAPMNYYVIGRNVMDNYWRGGTYAGSLSNAKALEINATDKNEYLYRGIARIYLANEFGTLTSCFGDVPFSEALQGTAFIHPKYDEQQDIYEGLQLLLDNAIVDLETAIDNNESVTADLIFNGDARKWIAAAYALKARYYVHCTKQIPEHWQNAVQSAENAFNNGFEDVNFTSIGFNGTFYDMLENDPRRPYYSITGYYMDYDIFHPDSTKLTWAQPDASVPIISACELHFILAENAILQGNNDQAVQHTRNALKANFEMLGILDSDEYLNSLDFGNMTLESLISESYKSYFGYNFLQVWVNYRRTGYPLMEDGNPENSNSFNPSGTVPRRYMYVESEMTGNRLSLEEAENRQGGGLLDNKIWAFE